MNGEEILRRRRRDIMIDVIIMTTIIDQPMENSKKLDLQFKGQFRIIAILCND